MGTIRSTSSSGRMSTLSSRRLSTGPRTWPISSRASPSRMHNTLLVVIVVVVALGFDFTNGFHDTANAIATSISTHALSPRVAVLMSGAMNFVGAFVTLKVAATIGSGVADPKQVTLVMTLCALIGAIIWNLITWYLGLPSSSSHALIGGLI